MTTYAVISDIHGNATNLAKALTISDQHHADFILVLGDLLNHGPRNGVPTAYDPMQVGALLNARKQQIIAVRGNCDSEVDSMVVEIPITSVCNTLVINKHRCFMTHGHKYKPTDYAKLALMAGDMFLSGHTHISVLERNDDGVIIFNPGSITFPKGNGIKSMGIITEKRIQLVDLDGSVLKELALS